ncbi:glycerol-3-phosphate acyltransferase PlsX [Ereboglobus sp. PH5-10]|uniref:phosphate acyltransferase PlsX n=1 Tax=Ereboglobus sp. PH5-10 TaxID=2940629 RepID=UPI002407059A|nr:phosphate acyltransferase PlsX [Ereboglobus sp. PH5-10]MDF9826894.1 glycerol-3-phosphate acyltransferase PlsX [Ereboglobus sp. PH5-10]
MEAAIPTAAQTVPPIERVNRIAVDAMGGDLGPAEVVAAVKLALAEFPDISPVTLVGDEAIVRKHVAEAGLDNHPKLSYFHASEVITMDDKPLVVLKKKKDASTIRAIELVKLGAARAVVSCANTGCLVGASIIKLRTLKGADRAALSAIIPRDGGHFVLIDAGANPEAKPGHLVHNAIMGSHFSRLEFGIEKPRVGLLTIGTEEGKGNALITQTHEALKRLGDLINYAGPVEGFQIFTNGGEHRQAIDVVVCDGFVGNICLKSWESLAKFFTTELKCNLMANPVRKLGALLAKGAFGELRERVKPERYGGAPLLGVKGVVVKAHGSANRQALKNAIFDASEMIKTDINQLIENDIARAQALIENAGEA